MGRLKTIEEERPERPRRRAGRLRRWVIRPLVWGLTILAILIFVLQLLLDTRWARDGARRVATERLSAALDREVGIVDLSFELLPLSVELWGLTISGPEDDDPNFIEIPFAAVDADLGALRRRRIHLNQVRIERPVVYLEFFPDGTHNMVKRREEPRKPRRFDIYIDRIEIERAEFGLDQRSVKLSLAADAVRTRLRGLGEMHLEGQLDAHSIVVRLPNARPFTVAASGRGSLRRGLVEIEDARITGPDITVTGSGVCEYPRESREGKNCLFQARGRTRGEALASIGYFEDLSGALTFDGSLRWRPQVTGWRSRLDAEQLQVWDRQIADFTGSLVADRYGFRIGIDDARYAGGRLGGELTWETKVEGRPWTIDLDFRGLELDTVLADQQIPTAGYASRLDGELYYRFLSERSARGDGHGEFEIAPDPQRPGVPLAGAFPLRIAGGIVRADSLSARSARQSVLATGWYDLERRAGTYDYEITSADLAELVPLLPLDQEAEPPLWLPTAGRGDLEGTLYIETYGPSGNGQRPAGAEETLASTGGVRTDLRIRLQDVVAPGVTTRGASGAMHLTDDAVRSLRLDLGDGEEALQIRGDMPYLATSENPAELTFEAFGWPLDTVHPWLDFDLPVGGRVSGHLDLTYDDLASIGKLDARVSPATLDLAPGEEARPSPGLLALDEIDLDEFHTRLEWDAEHIRFHHLELIAQSGVVTGSGTQYWATEALDLELSSPSLQLSEPPLLDYLPRADIRGEVEVSGRLGGTLQQPRLDLVVAADSLALGSRVLEGRPSRLEVKWGDGHFETRGRLLDMVTLDGGGMLEGGRAEIALRIDGNDLRGLAEMLITDPPEDLEGRFGGSLRIHGGGEDDAVADLKLDRLEVELGERQLASVEPVTARLETEHLAISSLRLSEAATDSEFMLTGTVGYAPPTSLDLDLDSSLSCTWLELLDLGFDVDGRLDVRGKVAGTFEQPTFEGQGELSGGRVALSEDLPLEIRELNGTVSFHPGHAVLDRLEGQLGGGRVALDGEAAFTAGSDEPLIYRLQLTGTDLDLRYLEGWSVRGEAALSLASAGERHVLDGRAALTAIEYVEDIRIDFEQLMRGFLQRQRLEIDPTDSVLSVVELNIDVEAPGAVRVRNNLADFTGSAHMLIRGNLAQPVLYGEVEIDPESTLIYNSTDYEIERGRVVFANPYEIDPEIDLIAVTRVREFDVTLAVDGTFDRLATRFSSEPPLPDLEVFRLLASGGDETTDTTLLRPQRTEIEEDPSTSAATFLYGQAASVIGQRVNNLFGFDKFRIDPLTGSGDQLSKARVTVGKRLSKDVLVTFSADPSSTEDQRLRIEWQVSPGMVLVLTQNGDDSYSADARWESSF
ncbi:MAG: hypothetical protein GY719_23910 [bacterium]|nr:hypothetical protein [bacterium]